MQAIMSPARWAALTPPPPTGLVRHWGSRMDVGLSTYQVTVLGREAQQDVQNVYTFHHPAMTADILTDTIDGLNSALQTIALWQSDDYTAGSYRVRRVDVADQVAIERP